jgi:glycosyltransferase involved in cell wall biosynthesis/radical SAM superfamily enzyme YgiQ (UPF0313 family)
MAERAHPEDPGFQQGSPYRAHLFMRYAFANKFTEGKTVLDIPCGVGWGTSLLKGKRRIGVDISKEAVDYARRHYQNIEFLHGSMADIPVEDNSIDVIVCMEGFEHVTKDIGSKFLEEASRVIKKDGLLVMTTPVIIRGGKHSGNPYHLYEPTLDELKKTLSGKFNTVSFHMIEGPDNPIAYFVGTLKSKIALTANKSKHILLTTSAAPDQSPFSTTEKRPPIGIGFLISVLRNAGHEVFFIDNYLKPSNFLETDYLIRNSIDYVGIYANTICFRDTHRMLYRLEYLRKTGKWQGKIIIGGPHTTVSPDTIPEFVDYIVQGEGERAIIDIIDEKVKERIVKYPPIENLDELPMPAWDYFTALPYKWDVDWFPEKPVFTMNTSRGCPFRCAFCSVDSIWGKRYNFFSAERLVSDIEYLIKNYGAKGIYFREDNFTLNKKRLTQFCNLLIQKGINIPWACETRVNTLNRELVELMHRAGARAFYLGVESGSQRILDFLNKGITTDQIRNAFNLCHEYGIKTAASIITGIPGETEDDVLQTARLLQEVKPAVTWYNVFVGIPRSELYRYVLDNNLYEFVDDRGLVYLKGHNERVRRFYGNRWNADVPITVKNNQIVDPEISVVMSTYNNGKFLEEAVNSVLKQTVQNFEFIIIDDASTDNTPEILKKLSDPRVRITRNAENLGLTKSLNRGIEYARGKYIARMDADDVSLPHRFEIQLEFLKRNPDHALVGSSYYQMDEKGDIKNLIRVLTEDPDIREGLKQQNWFGHGSVLMRKDALLKAGGYNEKFKYAQDYELWLRLAEDHKIANIEEPLYCWRSTSCCISREKEEEQRYYARLAVSESDSRRNGHAPGELTECLVSVIIPTFSRPGTLIRAVESVLNQTVSDFEIIVVNDAGADVENVVNGLNKRGKITYVRHSKNRGLAAARNTGIKLARGKYIAYLDDDDIFYTDHLETLVNVLENSDYRIAYTDAYRSFQVKENGKYIEKKKDIPYSYDFDYDQILVTNFIPVLCFMHEKSCFNKTGLFDESLKVLEDWDLWIRMSRNYELYHIKKATAEFTWRNDGSTMTSNGQAEFLRTGKIIQERYKKYDTDKPHIMVSKQKTFREERKKLFEQSEHPLVSIIIPAFDNVEQTLECMKSVASDTSYNPYEVIVVDCSLDERSSDIIRKCVQGDMKIISVNNAIIDYHEACNRGSDAAEGKYIAFLDSNLTVSRGWLTELVQTAECNDDIGIAGGKILCSDNSVGNAGIVLNKDGTPLNVFAGVHSDNPAVNDQREIDAVSGSCMLIKADLFLELGRFGKGECAGDVEKEMCLKAKKRGYRTIYNPLSVLHQICSTAGDQKHGKEHFDPALFFKEQIAEATKYLSEEKKVEAIAIFVKLLDEFPQIDDLYTALCDLYISIGWKTIPRDWIIKAFKHDPTFCETFRYVAEELFAEGEYIKSYEILSLLKDVTPNANMHQETVVSQPCIR